MIKEKIIITTEISNKNPIRRVHIVVGDVFDYHEEYGDDDELATVLRSVVLGIENKFRAKKKNG